MDYFQTVKKSLDQVDSATDSGLKFVFKSKWAQAILYLLIILYATKFAPSMPRQAMDLIDNQFFKIFVFFLVIWSAKHSPTTALVISVAFLMVMNYVNNVKMFEKMENDLKQEVLNTELSTMQPSGVPDSAAGEVVLPPVIVEPKVVTTADGTQMVVNPQVIVASKEVTTPTGETVVVTPEVTQLPMSQPSVPVQPQPELPVQPSEAQPPAQFAEAEVAKSDPPKTPYSESCFAMQSYDMSKVSGVEYGDTGYAAV